MPDNTSDQGFTTNQMRSPTAEQEIERLRKVVFRWGRVLVAKGEAAPREVVAAWSGDEGRDGIYPVMPEDNRRELEDLHRPWVTLLKWEGSDGR